MTIAEQQFPYVWREERVVAVPKGLPTPVKRQFTDKGLLLVQFDPKNPASAETIDEIADALGAT